MARSWMEQQVQRLTARPDAQTARNSPKPFTCCEVLRDGDRSATATAKFYDLLILDDTWARMDVKPSDPARFGNAEGRPVYAMLRNVSCPATIALTVGAHVVAVGVQAVTCSVGDEFEANPDGDFDLAPIRDGNAVLLAGAGGGGSDEGVVAD